MSPLFLLVLLHLFIATLIFWSVQSKWTEDTGRELNIFNLLMLAVLSYTLGPLLVLISMLLGLLKIDDEKN